MRSRDLSAAAKGRLLLVDAFQGVEAQTVANAYAAMDHDLKIIPVINKVDLMHARVDEVAKEMEQILGIDQDDIVRCSGKAGIGIDELIEAIIRRVPPPAVIRRNRFKRWCSIPTMTIIEGAITTCA